jgi:hypothetical protein
MKLDTLKRKAPHAAILAGVPCAAYLATCADAETILAVQDAFAFYMTLTLISLFCLSVTAAAMYNFGKGQRVSFVWGPDEMPTALPQGERQAPALEIENDGWTMPFALTDAEKIAVLSCPNPRLSIETAETIKPHLVRGAGLALIAKQTGLSEETIRKYVSALRKAANPSPDTEFAETDNPAR